MNMFTYRIHNLQSNRVHNVNEAFVLSWLKVDQQVTLPHEKLQQLKRDCFIHGHATVTSGSVGGGSYLVMTKATAMDRQNLAVIYKR
jgi:hypothetical protein